VKTLSELENEIEDEIIHHGEELSDYEKERGFGENVADACGLFFLLGFCACFLRALDLFFYGDGDGIRWVIMGGIIFAYSRYSSSHSTGIYKAISLWRNSIARRELTAWRAYRIANVKLFVVQVAKITRRNHKHEIVVKDKIDRPLFIVTKNALMQEFANTGKMTVSPWVANEIEQFEHTGKFTVNAGEASLIEKFEDAGNFPSTEEINCILSEAKRR
jgi:hypothetical protein